MIPNTTEIGDGLNRLVKLAMDTGEAASVEEAMAVFARYALQVIVSADAAKSPTQQAALLTVVNTGRRSLLGGVYVDGALDEALCVPLVSGASTLGQAVIELGGHIGAAPEGAPLVVMGDFAARASGAFALRITFQGWRAACVPLDDSTRLNEEWGITTAGVAAGSLAVSEVFQFLRGNPIAGRRGVGISLWEPDRPWLDAPDGPYPDWLPASAWLIGLGNLGQAYLWTLGLLPYADPAAVKLVLQDFDTLAPSNDSTSVLSKANLSGQRKTRAMASWTDARGFGSDIIERRFGPNFRVESQEPQVALCGIDNAVGRSALEDVGFARVFEAGLGKGTSEFLAMRLHGFPAYRTARAIWSAAESTPEATLLDQPAYRALARAGADRCGITQLAGRSVGAPFVGCFAASLVISELMRLPLGGANYEVIDLHLKAPEHAAFVRQKSDFGFNPGVTPSLARHYRAKPAVTRTFCSPKAASGAVSLG